jgi:hypothetical protein
MTADVFSGFCAAGACWMSLIAFLAIGFVLLRGWLRVTHATSIGDSLRLAVRAIAAQVVSVWDMAAPSSREVPAVQRWLGRTSARRSDPAPGDDLPIETGPGCAQTPKSAG